MHCPTYLRELITNKFLLNIFMASNKNQHFVPRCYLRPFTHFCENKAINLFNLDHKFFIEGAPVKNQCSGSYFYGDDLMLEKALQGIEGAYANVVKEIQQTGYLLTKEHAYLLQQFWLLQYLRTEAASRRSLEMIDGFEKIINSEDIKFRIEIREAVKISMLTFITEISAVSDLKICLFKNKTNIPFITSDDPAVLTNRWYPYDRRTGPTSFGLHSSGAIILLPISPKILCLGYDSDVYSITNKSGWVDLKNEVDVNAFNQHQFINCRANVFVKDKVHASYVNDEYEKVEKFRPKTRHRLHYAVLDKIEGNYKRYRVIKDPAAEDHREAIIHSQMINPLPSVWPKQIQRRSISAVYTNGTGVGYLRKAWLGLAKNQGFKKQKAWNI